LDDVDIDLDNQAQTSLKSFLLPQQQVLFEYKKDQASGPVFKAIDSGEPTVFFGLRSCDLSAILYMDVIFLKGEKDPYYRQKREDNILISIGCNDPFANCFCRQTKNGPFLEHGFDLQLTDLGDRYFVETGRTQGEEIVRQWAHFFTPASQEDERAQYQVRLEAQGNFKRQVLVDLAIRKLQDDLVSEEVWSKLSSRCQDCGGCAYICPTCTCFTIDDRKTSEESGERIRSWDACTFAGFTSMAGGHNPIDMDKERIKRRFMHKLYYDVKAHSRPSCVGCGRCVGICFGGTDIVRFIKMAGEE
jgi:formate hydrogenlyase subunit 6/NADH:ubiquinone oxidoreductase subunit I